MWYSKFIDVDENKEIVSGNRELIKILKNNNTKQIIANS